VLLTYCIGCIVVATVCAILWSWSVVSDYVHALNNFSETISLFTTGEV